MIATNHSEFDGLPCRARAPAPGRAALVDPWNVTGSAQVFAFADEPSVAGSARRAP